MPLRLPALPRRAAALALAATLLVAACGGDEEKRLDQLNRAGIIAAADVAVLRDDLRAGGVRAAEARHDIEMFSRSRDALASAGFPDLDTALGRLDALRTSGTIGAAQADRLKSGLVAVWDAPAVSAAVRRVSWLESRKDALHGNAPANRNDEAPPAPERVFTGSDDPTAKAMLRIDKELASARARELISSAFAEALRLRAASSDEGRAAVETRLDHLLATAEAPPALPEPADTAPPSNPSNRGDNP